MGGGGESPEGIETPRLEEFPRWDETSGVPTKGGGVPGGDGQGRGVDVNPPTTQAIKASGASGGDEGMMFGPGTAAPPIPQLGTAADKDSMGTLHRHSDGADGARPENGMELRRKYGLLAPEEPAGDPAAAGTQVIGAGQGPQGGWNTRGRRQRRRGTGPGIARS